jgi:hypothetical protein
MVQFVGHTRILGQAGEDRVIIDHLPTLTSTHNRPGHLLADSSDGEVRDTLDIDGGGATDDVEVIVSSGDESVGPIGSPTDYIINVHDTGAPDDGADTLTITGTEIGDAGNTSGNDLFLLRKNFVAYLTSQSPLTEDQAPGELLPQVERINYDPSVNGRLRIDAGSGADQFYVDDNSAITTLDGGLGNDLFQVGQVFGTNPNGFTYPDSSVDPRVVANDNQNIDLTSDGDDIELQQITRGWLSPGITFPMTIYGGEDGDAFSVYSNKAVLRMEGEGGNDNFVIRAFVVEDDILAGGGEGDDTFHYNINAPVSINGGDGFDTVVALGTEKADAFIISEEGIFGAGLSIRVDGVEEALEVDGLEGDDQFFILGTRHAVVTTVIGGLGSDTFNVSGNVTANVISQDLNGVSGVINHGAVSPDTEYDKLLVDGLRLTIADERHGKVVIDESDGRTELVEDDGSVDVYEVSLAVPITMVSASTVLHITVSAPRASSYDTRRPRRNTGDPGGPHAAESVLLSVDNGATYVAAGVLTFDQSNWSSPQRVMVRAAHDDAIEGERNVEISHSIVVESNSAADRAMFRPEDVPIRNVKVRVVDEDLGSVLIQETDGGTLVLEGQDGAGAISDTYDMKLSVPPTANVTVNLSHDDQIQVFDESNQLITSVAFTPGNWDQMRTLTVKAFDDFIPENPVISRITHEFDSTDAVYGAAAGVELDVRVEDNEAARVLVTESDGGTRLVKGVSGDDYRLRLVNQPA